jgi:uncharacterized repeat protein (TIGR01451 family)
VKQQPSGIDFAGPQRGTEFGQASFWRTVALIAGVSAASLTPAPALADPAANAASFSQTTAGAVSTTVPDGTCSAALGAAGDSSGINNTTGGRGGAGARIAATFRVLALQAVTGTVGQGGEVTTATIGADSGAGNANGGSGGTVGIATIHRGDSNDSQTASITAQNSADLRVTKTNGVSTVTSGSTVTYTVEVTNVGPDPVVGAVVTDVIGADLTCPATNAATITGSGIPAGSFTISNLDGAGIALGTLISGQSATLSYSCRDK